MLLRLKSYLRRLPSKTSLSPSRNVIPRNLFRVVIRLFRVVEDVGKVAATAVLTVVHGSHEDTSTAGLVGALPPQTLNLAVTVDLVVLKHRELGLLALVLDLLGRSVHLLLTLLGHTTAQAQDQVKGGLLLDVVVREGTAVLELLASEDQALLVRRNALLVLDLALDIVDGVRGLHLKGDGLAREGLDEDLHLRWLSDSSGCFPLQNRSH